MHARTQREREREREGLLFIGIATKGHLLQTPYRDELIIQLRMPTDTINCSKEFSLVKLMFIFTAII